MGLFMAHLSAIVSQPAPTYLRLISAVNGRLQLAIVGKGGKIVESQRIVEVGPPRFTSSRVQDLARTASDESVSFVLLTI